MFSSGWVRTRAGLLPVQEGWPFHWLPRRLPILLFPPSRISPCGFTSFHNQDRFFFVSPLILGPNFILQSKQLRLISSLQQLHPSCSASLETIVTVQTDTTTSCLWPQLDVQNGLAISTPSQPVCISQNGYSKPPSPTSLSHYFSSNFLIQQMEVLPIYLSSLRWNFFHVLRPDFLMYLHL